MYGGGSFGGEVKLINSIKVDSILTTIIDSDGALITAGAVVDYVTATTPDSINFKVDATNISQVQYIIGNDTIKESFDHMHNEYALKTQTGYWQQSGDTLSPLTSSNSVQLETTTDASTGIIFKDNVPFIHDFHHPTGGGAIPRGKNIFIGEGVGNFTMGSTATASTHSSYNIGIGSSSLISNTLGHTNIAVGSRALTNNTEGSGNMAIGDDALSSNTTGDVNTAVGQASLGFNTEGLGNTAIGSNSLQNITTGNQNIGIGWTAGRYYGSGADANTTPTKSIYLGYNTRASANGQTNQIVIGPDAIGNGSNTATILDNNGTDVWMGENGQAATIQTIAKLLPTADPPGSPSLGWIYADTDTHLYFYNGSSWVQLDN
jgi:hypothetical protein